jgi:hypothetical protein
VNTGRKRKEKPMVSVIGRDLAIGEEKIVLKTESELTVTVKMKLLLP